MGAFSLIVVINLLNRLTMKLSGSRRSTNNNSQQQLPHTMSSSNSAAASYMSPPTQMTSSHQNNYDYNTGYSSAFDPTSQQSFDSSTPMYSNTPSSSFQPNPNQPMGFQPGPFMMPNQPMPNQQQSMNPQMQSGPYDPTSAAGATPFMNPVDLMNNPAVAQFAMQYGTNLADSGRAVLNERVERFLSVTKLKHYFAVDTNYVLKKLKILTLPFLHKEWQVSFNQDDPVAPQFDVNVPDLYIPSMAFVTYILLAGVCLGIKNKFSPEDLGIIGSSALAWYLLELFLVYAMTFVLNINTSFRSFIDVLAFCGYKFYAMLILLLASIAGGSMGFYGAWVYTSMASVYFMIKTIRLCILSNVSRDSYVQQSTGQKRRWYFLLYLAGTQPILTYWLTTHVAVS